MHVRYVVVVNCIAWHRDKENNVVYTNVTWSLAFRPKQTVQNRCSRGYVVPLFSSKKTELFTGDNLGRSSDAFSPFSRHRSSSFECRTTVPPCRPTPRKYVFWRHSNWSVVITISLSSPSNSKVVPSIDRRKDGYFAQFKAEKSLIVLGLFVGLTS